MKNNKLICIILLLLPFSQCIASVNDSIFIEELLSKSMCKDFTTNEEKLLFFAGAFQGKPYLGGTLDRFMEEKLVVRTDSLDCTTFVETVMALFIASKETSANYKTFCDVLIKQRYRNGIINGYVSRLHYFSDWVSDNITKGLIEEVTFNSSYEIRRLSIDFMSTHYKSYNILKRDTILINEMRIVERKWKDYEMPYIPKKQLNLDKSQLSVDNGDIIALTTSINGLDVVHLGFAFWINDKLHLLHASSAAGKVILDKRSLFDYMKNKPKHTGIRVVRII